MKIVTFNVNGVRSALSKGLNDWLENINPDIVCMQEIKLHDSTEVKPTFEKLGYQIYWFPAEKKGYSGVAVLTKLKPNHVDYGMHQSLSNGEGRVITLFYSDFTLINAYFPSGTTGDVRQQVKYQFLDEFFNYTQSIKSQGKPVFVTGDINICHQAIDIHNPISNAKSSGFLPEERAWLTKFIDSGFTDTFRYKIKEPHNYTWWSYRAGARSKNLGWRIDYIFAANLNLEQLASVHIYSDVVMSDHCPMSIEYTHE